MLLRFFSASCASGASPVVKISERSSWLIARVCTAESSSARLFSGSASLTSLRDAFVVSSVDVSTVGWPHPASKKITSKQNLFLIAPPVAHAALSQPPNGYAPHRQRSCPVQGWFGGTLPAFRPRPATACAFHCSPPSLSVPYPGGSSVLRDVLRWTWNPLTRVTLKSGSCGLHRRMPH